MNKKDKFKFEHEKPNPEIIGHHSTPETFSKLLVELLGLNQVQGQIIYDGGIGVGGLSATVDTKQQIQEELIKKEALLKQKVLNLLIQKEAATKASINFPPPPPPPVEKEVENNQFNQIDQRVKEIDQRLEEIEDDVLESDNSVCGLLKRLKKRELKKAQLLEEMKKKQELLREALLYIDMSKLKNYEKEK
ncbi:1182_t:CDS:2 [Paraglomus brasilianum]|uniref:1182_t:CDS:1 n=1 Tax=Paraglomus brasilianum TaxID=144538 RepID=A0A9N9B1W1_9GLOM|nr:1182_t:CDS:2 [Paraglomus brasilianum]